MNAKADRQQRLVTLLVVLVLVAAGAWMWQRTPERRQPPPTASKPVLVNPEETGLTLSRKQTLPEFAEVDSFYPLKDKGLPREKVRRAIELSTHRIWLIRVKSIIALGCAEDAARPEALAAVLERLRDPDINSRLAAMDALARLDARDHIPDLLPFLNSTDNSERKNAKDALKKLGHPID